MLQIRKQQVKVLRQAVLKNFEDRMIEHLLDFAPHHSLSLGEEGVRKVVQLGILRAETYGLTTHGPVQFYIEMMFMFGSYFDMDCQLPWAGQILTDPAMEDQDERADALFEKAMEYLDTVGGPNREYAIASLERAGREKFEEACESTGDLEADILPRLKLAFPEKCNYVGNQVLLALVQRGREQAKAQLIDGDPGIICLVFFMFMLGEGFAQDPLYPWCSETLQDEEIGTPDERAERLFSKGMAYIKKTLKNLGKK